MAADAFAAPLSSTLRVVTASLGWCSPQLSGGFAPLTPHSRRSPAHCTKAIAACDARR